MESLGASPVALKGKNLSRQNSLESKGRKARLGCMYSRTAKRPVCLEQKSKVGRTAAEEVAKGDRWPCRQT